jgi:hypothetical protein
MRETGKVIQGATGYSRESADFVLTILNRVAMWDRASDLQNRSTKMNSDDVPFRLFEVLGDDDQERACAAAEVTIDIGKEGDDWEVVELL